jgi:hypothetical protein
VTIGQSTVIRWAGRAVAAPTLIGVSTLAAGAVYYLSVRPMAIAAGFASTDAQRLPVIAIALGSLPTFLHVLAFSMLTGALGESASSRIRSCTAWAGVNALFEVAQHATVARLLAEKLDLWCGEYFVCARTGQYFLRGTFDIADIAAGALGGLLAYTILKCRSHHAESVS